MSILAATKIINQMISSSKDTGLGNPNALWKAIQERINKQNLTDIQVAKIMSNWTTQPGYPLVSVTINKDVVRVTQERFLLRNFFQDKPPANTIWSVPLSWTTQKDPNFNNTNAKHWLSTKEDVINLKVDSESWLIFNIQSSGS
jgi:aminopeptidase N